MSVFRGLLYGLLLAVPGWLAIVGVTAAAVVWLLP